MEYFRIRGVAQECAFALDSYQSFGFKLVEVMGKSGVWDIEFLLDFSHDETFRVSRQEQLNDAEPCLCSHSGEHIGVPGNLVRGGFAGYLVHISRIAEIWKRVKSFVEQGCGQAMIEPVGASPLPLPRLDESEISFIIQQVAEYIDRQRQTYRGRAVHLNAGQKVTMKPFFPASTLESVKVLVLTSPPDSKTLQFPQQN